MPPFEKNIAAPRGKRGTVGAVLLFFVFLALPVRALAQWSLSAGVGKVYAAGRELRLVRPPFQTDLRIRGVRYRDRSFEFPLYYNVRLFHRLSGGKVEIGFGFTHAKVYADPDRVVQTAGVWKGLPVHAPKRFGDVISAFSISHGLNLLALSAQRNFLRNRFGALWFGAGFGLVLSHTEVTLSGRHEEHYELDGPLFRLGLEVRVPACSSVALSFRLSGARIWLRHLDVPDGSIGTELVTWHIEAGPVFRF